MEQEVLDFSPNSWQVINFFFSLSLYSQKQNEIQQVCQKHRKRKMAMKPCMVIKYYANIQDLQSFRSSLIFYTEPHTKNANRIQVKICIFMLINSKWNKEAIRKDGGDSLLMGNGPREMGW